MLLIWLGSVCKTLVRERLWHGTRRFDRQTVGTLGATPAPSEAKKGPSQCRSSAYHKRHALDRSHRITLARPPPEVWSLEDGCQPLLGLAEGWGVGSATKSSAEPKRPTRRAGLGGQLSGCDHSWGSSARRRGKRGDPKSEALGYSLRVVFLRRYT